MIFSYRTRRFLGRLLRLLATTLVVCLVVGAFWLLWLQRFIVYTPDGVKLDFSLSQKLPEGVIAKPPVPGESVSIQYGEELEATNPGQTPTMQKVVGYYLTVDQLVEDLEGVLTQIRELPRGTAVLLDVKGTWGYFFYPTQVGDTTSESFDMAVMEQFFSTVNSLELYTIARLPAFQDYDFGRKNYACGLEMPGGYLYAGENNCYWLDPTDDIVLSYLIQISRELRDLGFDEVAFKDFSMPEDENILFTGDRAEAINKAAKTLVTACASSEFAVSFITNDERFLLPEGNCRLYLTDVAAADVQDVLSRFALSDPEHQVVFLAQTNDTRYEVSGTLRPIDMAH